MRLLPALLFAASAAAELTVTVTAFQDGKEVDASHLQFESVPWRSRTQAHWIGTNSTGRRGGGSGGEEKIDKRDGDISFSSTWCGMSQQQQPGSNPLKTVYGAFSAPNLHDRTGTYPQFAAAFVGMDGASCRTALLQAGVTTILNSNGQQSAQAWWEWYPENSVTISNYRVHAGDWMAINVTAIDATTAQLTILNYNSGLTIVMNIKNGPPLCRADADWIVEDFTSAGNIVDFARFDDVWFEDATAYTVNGATVGLDGATPIYLGDTPADALCVAEPYDSSDFVCSSQN